MNSIVIRAADPAAAAETLRAIGIELAEPDRPNPGRWHGSCRVSICVDACATGERPSIALGCADVERVLARLPGGTLIESDGDTARLDVGGLPLPLVADAGPVSRPGLDQALLPHAEVILIDARDALSGAFSRLGVRNARLAGPELMLGRLDAVFTLVVDGVDEKALGELDGILAAHAHPALRIEARSSASLDPGTLARVDRLAWDVRV